MPLSYKNDSNQDDRLNPYELRERENAGQHDNIPGYDRSADGLDDHPISGGATSGESENIKDAGQREKDNPYGYSENKNSSTQPRTRDGVKSLASRFAGALRGRKAATGGIIGLFALATVLAGGVIGPGLALVHIKEVVENKINSMASVVDTRMQKIIAGRMKSQAVSGKCTGIKIACKYKSFSQSQLDAIKEKGGKVVDGNGKEIAAGESPGKDGKMVIDGKEYKASEFASKIKSDPVFRNSMRGVFPTRFAVWNDKIASKFIAAKKINKNPKWTAKDEGGDPKENLKEVNKNVAQNNLGGDSPNVDPGEYSDAIDEQKKGLTDDLDKGGTSTELNSETTHVLNSPDVSKGFFSSVGDFVKTSVNPAGFYVGACTTRSYLKAIVTASKIAATAQTMRWAFQLFSTADKIKAGEATPNDVEQPMTMLYRENSNGDNFGDSTGYHYAEYGKTTDTPIEAALQGSALLGFFVLSLKYINNILGVGSQSASNTSCNGFVQIGVSLLATAAAFLTGGTSAIATKAAETGAKEAGDIIAKGLVKQFVDKIATKAATKFADKAATKATLKESGRTVLRQGGAMLGFFLAGLLIGKYFVPYAAHLATGTLYSGDMNGVSALDTAVSGMGASNAGVAQSRGLTTMTQDQALVFNNYDSKATATYVADMQASANPFDLNDPYSASSNMGYSLSTFLSNTFKSPSSVIGLPASIVSSVMNPSALSPSAYADDQADQKALMAECQDTDATQDGTIATDPFCNPLYGFDDMSALQNYEPEDVATAMRANGYINDDGTPVGDYATYVQDCFDGATDKIISSLTDNDLDPKCYNRSEFAANTSNYNSTPSVVMAKSSNNTASLVPYASYAAACDKDKNKPEITLASAVVGEKKSNCDKLAAVSNDAYTLFHLYQIDNGITTQMDDPYKPTNGSTSATTNSNTGSNTTTISGDAASLAQQILSNTNITLSDNSRDDITKTSQGQPASPGPNGDGGSGAAAASGCQPVALHADLLKVALTIAQKYPIYINDIVSGHQCDTAQHPKGRAMDIFKIGGADLNDSWWASDANVATINDIAKMMGGLGTYPMGFGVGCSAVSKINAPSNLVVFNDSCSPQDEIHVDVRGAP